MIPTEIPFLLLRQAKTQATIYGNTAQLTEKKQLPEYTSQEETRNS